MKALLIAENEKVIDGITNILANEGYDVIVYRWLLKALDNIEEISPHLIVISAKDYPRHWKTLVQYTASIFKKQMPEIILYANMDFSGDEKNKAKALHIRGVFYSTSEEGLEGFKKILESRRDSVNSAQDINQEKINYNADEESGITTVNKLLSIPKNADEESNFPEELRKEEELLKKELDGNDFFGNNSSTNTNTLKEGAIMEATENKTDEKPTIPCSFVFTNPVTLAMVSGTARNYNGETLEFIPDIPSFVATLSPGTKIDLASMKTEDGLTSVNAEVIAKDNNKVILSVKK